MCVGPARKEEINKTYIFFGNGGGINCEDLEFEANVKRSDMVGWLASSIVLRSTM